MATRKRKATEAPVEVPIHYEVEAIIQAKRTKSTGPQDGQDPEGYQYLIKWVGYPHSENTWEPSSSLAQCQEILQSFWNQKHGYVCQICDSFRGATSNKTAILGKWTNKVLKAINAEKSRKKQKLTAPPVEEVSSASSPAPTHVSEDFDTCFEYNADASTSAEVEAVLGDAPEDDDEPILLNDHDKLSNLSLLKRVTKNRPQRSTPVKPRSSVVTLPRPRPKRKVPKRARLTKRATSSDADSAQNLPTVYINPRRTRKRATDVAESNPVLSDGKIPSPTLKIPPRCGRARTETSPTQQSPEQPGEEPEHALQYPETPPAEPLQPVFSPDEPIVSRSETVFHGPATEPLASWPDPVPPIFAGAGPVLADSPSHSSTGSLFSETSEPSLLVSDLTFGQQMPATPTPAPHGSRLLKARASGRRIAFVDEPITLRTTLSTKQRVAHLTPSWAEVCSLFPEKKRIDPVPRMPQAEEAPDLRPSASTLPVTSVHDDYPMLEDLFPAQEPRGANTQDFDPSEYIDWENIFQQSQAPTAPTLPHGPPAVSSNVKKTCDIVPKKPCWVGAVIMDLPDGCIEFVSQGQLSHPSEPEGDYSFLELMRPRKSLHLRNFHELHDMPEFLKACQPVAQWARLGPNSIQDEGPLKILTKYMEKHNKVILVPTYVGGDCIGHILLFCPSMKLLIHSKLKVPPDVPHQSYPIAALIPWSLSPAEIFKLCSPYNATLSAGTPKPPPMYNDPARWTRSILTKPRYQMALRVLNFPKEVHKFVAENSGGKFIAWWKGSTPQEGDGTEGLETRLLFHVMMHCYANDVGICASKVVFVHVGALRHISMLPLLAQRRKMPDVNFYSYGSHESIDPSRWGVHEIYPIGGVVTFSPSVLCENLDVVVNRIIQLTEHPLWACYLIPSVLGMAVRLVSGNDDPLERRTLEAFDTLLEAIDQGKLALLQAPPLERMPTAEHDPIIVWVRKHWLRRPRSHCEVLRSCVEAFDKLCADVQMANWQIRIRGEVIRDLKRMQEQPIIMENYRRFVVLDEARTNGETLYQDGFEFVSVANFKTEISFPGK